MPEDAPSGICCSEFAQPPLGAGHRKETPQQSEPPPAVMTPIAARIVFRRRGPNCRSESQTAGRKQNVGDASGDIATGIPQPSRLQHPLPQNNRVRPPAGPWRSAEAGRRTCQATDLLRPSGRNRSNCRRHIRAYDLSAPPNRSRRRLAGRKLP
jgi:hypothetical protein